MPTAVGVYTSSISLTVDGYDGSLTTPLSIGVLAPTLVPIEGAVFGQGPSMGVGIALDHLPVVKIGTTDTAGHPTYVPQPGDVLLFRVVSGSAPPGVSLDPATGTLIGTPTVLGPSTLGVTLTVTHGGSSFTTSPVTVKVATVEAPWTLSYSNCCVLNEGDDISLSPTSTFYPVPGATSTFSWYGTLPANVTLDPATGHIAGWFGSRGQLFAMVTQTVTFADGSVQSATAPGLVWNVTGPLFNYGSSTVYTFGGQSFSFSPGPITGGLIGDVYSFSMAAAPGTSLPTWLNIDATTGRLYGVGNTPTQSGQSADITVVLSTTRNGHTFDTTTNLQIAIQ